MSSLPQRKRPKARWNLGPDKELNSWFAAAPLRFRRAVSFREQTHPQARNIPMTRRKSKNPRNSAFDLTIIPVLF
jgi:hypothetical protein